MKQYTYAGVSRYRGELKLRFANDQGRIAHLIKVGHTEVEMMALSGAMDKDAAVKELLARNFDNGRSEIAQLLAGRARGAKSSGVTVRVRANKNPASRVLSTTADPVEDYFMAVEAGDVKLTPRQAAKLRAEFNERVRQAYEAN